MATVMASSALSALSALLLLGLPASAQAPKPSPAPPANPQIQTLKSWITVRQQRVDLLREEIKQGDAHIEAGLDSIVDTLKALGDSKDSRTKVARIKADTGQKLLKSMEYYDQKRAALQEELRRPQLQLTEDEKRRLIAAFDARIEKRIKQVLELNKSMPTHEDYTRYRSTGGGYWGTDYERNLDFEQNRRVTTKSNQMRDAIIKQLDLSIDRLDRQARTLRTEMNATSDPEHQKALSYELAKTDGMISERRSQKLETLKPSATATSSIGLKEAMDLDKALQTSVADLRRDFTTLFARYNSYLIELSELHRTEAALAAASKR